MRPSRALAFDKLPDAVALRRHPDLAGAIATPHAAARHFQAALPGDGQAQRNALHAVRAHVQAQQDQGDAKGFNRPAIRRRPAPTRSIEPPASSAVT